VYGAGKSYAETYEQSMVPPVGRLLYPEKTLVVGHFQCREFISATLNLAVERARRCYRSLPFTDQVQSCTYNLNSPWLSMPSK